MLAALLDAVFCFACSFLFSFFLFNYFTDRVFSLIFALLFAVVFAAISFKIISDKDKKKSLGKKEKRECDAIAFTLSLLPAEKLRTLLCSAFTLKGETPEKKKGGIYLKNSGVFILPDFSPCGADKKAVVKAYNGIEKDGDARVLCAFASGEVKEFAGRFSGKVEIKEKEYAYVLLKETGLLPAPAFPIKSTKKPSVFFAEFIKKKKARGFFLTGLFFLFIGFFVNYKIYYYAFGGLLLCFAALIRTLNSRLKD